ncbi:hypothetical protein ABT282_08710 [Streptomyces sp. NPDC000927]|uniref:hypothetical protein n=1 Tax=Streptomyces sp. NPDC000927 TaxID=3154371 RepID=UPI0033235AF2
MTRTKPEGPGRDSWSVPEEIRKYAQYTEFPYGPETLMNVSNEERSSMFQVLAARCGAQYSLLTVLHQAGLLRDPGEMGTGE